MVVLGLVFLALALWMLVSAEAWWGGRRVRRLREPQRYWTSLSTCVAAGLLCFVLAPWF